jgi:ribosome biogenesis GTPase
MSHKLSKRQVRSLKKQFENKERRPLFQESRRLRAAERAQQRRAPRRRDWHGAGDDAAPFEKIRRPRVELPRDASAAAPVETEGAPTGTVIEVRSSESLVSFEGRVLRATLARGERLIDAETRSPLAVGDRVRLEAAPGVVRIVAVLPRRSALARDVYDPTRLGASSKGHIIAANIDQVVVVCSPAEPPFRPRLIDRYLVAASRDALPVLICLNKTDLGVPDDVDALLRGYEALGAGCVRVSALSGEGIDALTERIAGTTSLFSGHSGVGKSSLLNAIEPGLALRVGDVTQSAAGQGKGRHTTSTARLVPLSLPETFVVDSPGIRAFGIKGIVPRELASHFADIAPLASGCAYRDCLHRGESGCAVAAAAARDAFLHARLDTYRTLLREVAT